MPESVASASVETALALLQSPERQLLGEGLAHLSYPDLMDKRFEYCESAEIRFGGGLSGILMQQCIDKVYLEDGEDDVDISYMDSATGE